MIEGVETYCRNCGVRIRRLLGRWWHANPTAPQGPVRCPGAEPE
jgi:hypothetical protein